VALWSLIEINYFFTPYFSLMGFCCVSWRSLRPVGLLALKSLKLLLRQLPTGAASRKKGSSTVGASLFLLVVLSSKIWAFWGCYGGRGRNCGVGACRWGGAVVRRRTRALASMCEAARGVDAPSRRAAVVLAACGGALTVGD
jgi:hypothetical protein